MLSVDALSVRLEDMHFRFSLEVAAGECVAVIGPSGAGKSTLLALIAGFETPVSGRIAIEGRDVTALEPALRPVSIVFQEHNLFPHLDVAANVGLGLHPALRLSPDDHAEIDGALKRVGLAGLNRRRPGQLSGGQRQRVALARAPRTPTPGAPPRRALRRARARAAPRDAGSARPAPERPRSRGIDGEPPP